MPVGGPSPNGMTVAVSVTVWPKTDGLGAAEVSVNVGVGMKGPPRTVRMTGRRAPRRAGFRGKYGNYLRKKARCGQPGLKCTCLAVLPQVGAAPPVDGISRRVFPATTP
ncbi:hypothetical protein GCM10012285_59260 [Streptomyces kronopolitis]|uniref:Uncharacterized protein n=1 Tax=Streptomyces kronopolitis TaxID=1612435 RepID=A0ABQ2K1B3_9ACTN|nr:hypothetical protein GCM10012285_59260 [Streptomyces kronopolitis]